MENQNKIPAFPHVKRAMSTAAIMQTVILALLPTAVFGIFNFGVRALLHMLVCVLTSVVTEFAFQAFTDRPLAVKDCSAAVTGLMLALTLPVGAPLWIGAVGSVFAILAVKMAFGGIGRNLLNPALTARLFLMLGFQEIMGNYACDAYSGATPLALLEEGTRIDPLQLIWGNTAGAIGETSAIMILLGAILLLSLGIINLRIPASVILSFCACMVLFGGYGFDEEYLISQLCGGGLMFGTWFMATDCATSPITKNGQLLYGVFIGSFAALLRMVPGNVNGILYAILLGNLLVPMIEKITVPKAFGKRARL